mmetsp:Transcript_8503/g.25502  ORF Transcript_8503/g.25502 Transcript_8503/m.25502 type:complete len:208 (+) Transcript_8503:600-1223(+)
MPGTGLRTSARAGDRRVAGHLATMKLLFSGREVYICVLTPNRCGNKRCERYVAEGAGRIMLDGPGWGAKSSWKLRQWRSKPLTGLTDWSWIVRPKLLCQICKSVCTVWSIFKPRLPCRRRCCRSFRLHRTGSTSGCTETYWRTCNRRSRAHEPTLRGEHGQCKTVTSKLRSAAGWSFFCARRCTRKWQTSTRGGHPSSTPSMSGTPT